VPSRPPTWSPTRRSALGLLWLAALGAPLAGCTNLPALEDVRVDPDWPGTAPPPVPDADELARRDAAGAARVLGASAAALRELAGGAEGAGDEEGAGGAEGAALALVADACAVHLEQLGEPVDEAAPTGPTATASGSPTARAQSAQELVADLVAASSGARAAVPGTSPGLARLLASVAASRALLARAVAGATGLPAPDVPEPLPPPGDASGPGGAERSAPPSSEGAALPEVAAGALAASRAAEVAAASLQDDDRDRALALRDALSQEAQALAAVLGAAGAEAPVAAPGYALPGPVTGAQEAVDLVVVVLERLAATALDAVPALEGDDRLRAADVLARTATAAAAWRPSPADVASTALPGTAAP